MDNATTQILPGQPGNIDAKLDDLLGAVSSLSQRQQINDEIMVELVTFLQRFREDVLEGQAAAQKQFATTMSSMLKVAEQAGQTQVAPRRLFISTGFFATAVAATLARQLPGRDNYLLIAVDRQSEAENMRFAYQLFNDWRSVQTSDHLDYYLNRNNTFSNPFSVAFDEVYSSHFMYFQLVQNYFPASRYGFFEEGLTTYQQARSLQRAPADLQIFALRPDIIEGTSGLPLKIDNGIFKDTIRSSIDYYDVPTFASEKNVIFIAGGLHPSVAHNTQASFSHFENYAAPLIGKGYTVWLKPHPRVDISHAFEGSALATAGVRLLKTKAPLLETIMMKNHGKVSAVVSSYSSFLVYSDTIFGVPAFSIKGDMPSSDQQQYKNIQDQFVPDIDDFIKML